MIGSHRSRVVILFIVFLFSFLIPYLSSLYFHAILTSFSPSGVVTQPQFEGQWLELHGARIRARTAGDKNAPKVVLIHGFGASGLVLQGVADALSDAFHVLVFDHPGFGFSTFSPETHNEAFYVRVAVDVMDAMGFNDGPVHLAGFSMGGAVAASIASQFPQRVKSVALMAPAGLPLPIPITGQISVLPVIGDLLMGYKDLSMAILARRYLGLVKPFVHNYLPGDAERALHYTVGMVGHNWNAYSRTLLDTLRSFPITALAHRYSELNEHKNIPTITMWGRNDTVVPVVPASEWLRARLPRTEFHMFEDTGHLLQWERRNEVVRLLRDFFTRHAAKKQQ